MRVVGDRPGLLEGDDSGCCGPFSPEKNVCFKARVKALVGETGEVREDEAS